MGFSAWLAVGKLRCMRFPETRARNPRNRGVLIISGSDGRGFTRFITICRAGRIQPENMDPRGVKATSWRDEDLLGLWPRHSWCFELPSGTPHVLGSMGGRLWARSPDGRRCGGMAGPSRWDRIRPDSRLFRSIESSDSRTVDALIPSIILDLALSNSSGEISPWSRMRRRSAKMNPAEESSPLTAIRFRSQIATPPPRRMKIAKRPIQGRISAKSRSASWASRTVTTSRRPWHRPVCSTRRPAFPSPWRCRRCGLRTWSAGWTS